MCLPICDLKPGRAMALKYSAAPTAQLYAAFFVLHFAVPDVRVPTGVYVLDPCRACLIYLPFWVVRSPPSNFFLSFVLVNCSHNFLVRTHADAPVHRFFNCVLPNFSALQLAL